MTTYRQWEIWDVIWEHEDGTSKRRPALLISDSQYNRTHKKLRFMKITTKFYPGYTCFKFSKKDPAFATTGLTKTCYLYLALLQKIPKKRIVKRRGYLGLLTRFAIDRKIRYL